jgi:hypothetical protein
MATNPLHDSEAELAKLIPRWAVPKQGRPLYHVRDWSAHFESSGTKKYRRLYSVTIPNKHEGKGYSRLTRLDEPLALFGAFILIVELASKAPARGYLCDEDGPWTPEEMAELTRMPEVPFVRALSELTTERIDWLEIVDWARTGRKPEIPSKSPTPAPLPGEAGRSREILGDSPTIPLILGESPSGPPPAGSKPEKPGESPSSETILGENGRSREICRVGLDRTGSERTGSEVPLSSPSGGTEVRSAPSETTAQPEKKEGGPGRVEIVSAGDPAKVARLAAIEANRALVEEARKFICELMGRESGHLGDLSMRYLWTLAEAGALPLPALQANALRKMCAARKKGAGDDLRLKKGWLQSAAALAEHFLDAGEGALAWLRDNVGGSPDARTAEKKEARPEPPGWREWLRGRFKDPAMPATFWDLPADLRSEFEKTNAGVAV